ncbi:unnamed protein product [Schistosoma rodhaini]|uniref:Kazal-like domain-containing protein n=1 Tax=Schistosoma rodhaini TaxID=6188 RepID=A0AA85FNR0_9TREM|nr:unnamed protein product [Schistosoma rodhaini]
MCKHLKRIFIMLILLFFATDLNCNISHKKFRCCNYANNLCVGTSFTNSLYSGCKLNLHSLKTLCFHCLTKMVILFHITDWLFLVTS